MYKKASMLLVSVVMMIVSFRNVSAQAKYPDRPIESIVGYAAGASTDVTARIFGEFLSKGLGQPVITLNKPGGGGAIAGNELFKRRPDGYGIGIFNTNQPTPEYCVNPERFIYKTGDILAVAQFSWYPAGIFVKYDAPWKSLKDFGEYAKKNPDTLRWGHNGRGNLWWILGSSLLQNMGVKLLDVPFEGDGQILTAILGDHIDMGHMTFGATVLAQVQAKKLRCLGLTSESRFELMPDVPTSKELGYPIGFPDCYIGVFVPKKTPKEIVIRLDEAVRKVVENPDFRKKMKDIYMPVDYKNTRDFEIMVDALGKKHFELLKKLGVL